MDGACGIYGTVGERDYVQILVGKPEGKRRLEIFSLILRWEVNVTLDLKKMGCEDVD